MDTIIKTQIHAKVPSLPLGLLILSTRILRTKRIVELSEVLIKPEVPALSPLKSISKNGNNIPSEIKEKMMERTINKM